MPRILLLMPPVLLVFLTGCHRSADPEGTLFLSGRIDGDTVDIAAKTPGRVAEVLVREGDVVKAGQVLARLDSAQDLARRGEAEARMGSARHRLEQIKLQAPVLRERIRQSQLLEEQARADARARVAQSEAQLAAVRSDLTRVQADLEQAWADATRYQALAERGAVAKQVAEQAQTRVRISQAQVEVVRKQVAAAEAGVEQSKAALANPEIRAAERATLQRQLSELEAQVRLAESDAAANEASMARVEADVRDLEIRAPIDGTILTRVAEPGRVVGAGATVLSMIDLGKLYLRGFVPEGKIGLVKVGQKAEIYLDSNPNQAIPAEVIRIDPQAMFTPENTYFREDRVKQVVGLKLLLQGAKGFAKPGMPADGRIQIGVAGKS